MNECVHCALRWDWCLVLGEFSVVGIGSRFTGILVRIKKVLKMNEWMDGRQQTYYHCVKMQVPFPRKLYIAPHLMHWEHPLVETVSEHV